MRSVARLVAAVALAGAALVGWAASSLAECISQPNRFPDYADVAPTAETVVIGTVVGTRPYPDAPSVVFSLRVDEVVRGDPPATMEVEVLRSGLPLRGAPACRASAALYVNTGDVIALALDGRLGRRGDVNTVAWIKGGPDEWVPGVRVMSRRQAIAAARALPPTDAVADPPAGTAGFVALVLRALTEAWAGAVAGEEPP